MGMDSSDWDKVAKFAVGGVGGYAVDEAFFAPTRRAGRAQEKAYKAEKEARAVSSASAESERQLSLRQKMREQRVMAAQLAAMSSSTGIEGSSSVMGTQGAATTLAAQGSAFSAGKSLANSLQSDLLQQSAGYTMDANKAIATGQMWKAGIDLGMKAITAGAG